MSPVLFYVGPSLTVNRMIWRTEKWEGGGGQGETRGDRNAIWTPMDRGQNSETAGEKPRTKKLQKDEEEEKGGQQDTRVHTHTHTLTQPISRYISNTHTHTHTHTHTECTVRLH